LRLLWKFRLNIEPRKGHKKGNHDLYWGGAREDQGGFDKRRALCHGSLLNIGEGPSGGMKRSLSANRRQTKCRVGNRQGRRELMESGKH